MRVADLQTGAYGDMSVAEIRAEIAALEGALARLHSDTWVVEGPGGEYCSEGDKIIHFATEDAAAAFAADQRERYGWYKVKPWDAGIIVWDGRDGDISDPPPGGALLEMHWANRDASWGKWYPSLEGAKAKLLEIARRNGRVPTADGLSVDLTAPGCVSSCAWVTRR